MSDRASVATRPAGAEAGILRSNFVRRFLRCRLCWRVSLTVLFSILVVEAVILFPSLRNYESDLLLRIEDAATAAMAARVNPHVESPRAAVVALSAAMSNYSALLGGHIYDAEGGLIAVFGDAPSLSLDEARNDNRRARRLGNGDRFELLWPRSESGLPYDIVARADSSWVAAELWGFVIRIAGLVLLISVVSTTAALLVLWRTVLMPLLQLRERMSAVGANPTTPEQHIVPTTRRDELGEVITNFNDLVRLISGRHREELTRVVAMADNAVDSIVAYNAAGDLVYANRAALTYFGAETTQQLEAFDWHFLAPDGTGPLYTVREAAANGASNQEHLLVMPDGHQRPVLCGANRLLDNAGEPSLYFASLLDITVRKAAEEALIAAKSESDAANRTKSEFLTTMSHELLTPLNAIIGFSGIIATEGLGPVGDKRYQDYANDIGDSGGRLLAIIEDILELSRIEAGRYEIDVSTIDLDDLLNTSVQKMQSDFDAKQQHVRTEIRPGLPTLDGDVLAIRRIVTNLLSNASKFTPDGGEVSVVAAAAPGGGLDIEVTDNGIGIDEDNLPRALEPFTQVDGSLSRRYEGTGLGLTLAATLARLHNGRVELRSQLGQGTTARVHFPAERCHPLAAAE